MTLMNRLAFASAVWLAAASSAWAFPVQAIQPVVDGQLAGDEAFYGPALSMQNTNTHFGNATNGDPRFANSGSEIDQVFATTRGGRLYVLIAGNLETNFNKLEVFIDSTPGGVNTIDGNALPGGVDPFCCGGFPPPNGFNPTNSGALQKLHGLTFDTGFNADHYLTFSNGVDRVGEPGSDIGFWTLTAYYADLTQGTAGNTAALGMQTSAFGQEPGLEPSELIDQTNNCWSSPSAFGTTPLEHEFAEPVIPGTFNVRGHRNLLNEIGLHGNRQQQYGRSGCERAVLYSDRRKSRGGDDWRRVLSLAGRNQRSAWLDQDCRVHQRRRARLCVDSVHRGRDS
jgi:hypothetical protein